MDPVGHHPVDDMRSAVRAAVRQPSGSCPRLASPWPPRMNSIGGSGRTSPRAPPSEHRDLRPQPGVLRPHRRNLRAPRSQLGSSHRFRGPRASDRGDERRDSGSRRRPTNRRCQSRSSGPVWPVPADARRRRGPCSPARWPHRGKLRHRTRDSSRADALGRATRPRRPAAGAASPASRILGGFLIVVGDISKRYLAETSLQKANDRLESQVREIRRLRQEPREQAIRDALTGMVNRRYLDVTMPRVLERAARDGQTVSVIMIDMGTAGDVLLSEFGAILSRRTRPGDIACRYGGEEFRLVLPHPAVGAAAERPEAIRRRSTAPRPQGAMSSV